MVIAKETKQERKTILSDNIDNVDNNNCSLKYLVVASWEENPIFGKFSNITNVIKAP